MRFNEDKKSGNQLSVLGMGCMRFPSTAGVINMEKTEEMLLNAVEKGIKYFDTAYTYPGSEGALGTILEKNSLREKVLIATKMPAFLCNKKEDFDSFFYKQLERLKTNYVDYYLMHMLQDTQTWAKLCALGIEEWIAEKKQKGEIRQIGFSFHGSMQEFLNLLEIYPWEFVQIQYNYSDENYQAGVTGLKKAYEKGIPVVVMEPLFGGKLAGELPEKAVELFKEANPKLTPVQWALRWLWNQPEVTVLLSGMSTTQQVNENVKTAGRWEVGNLSPEEEQVFLEVREILNATNKVPCTGCNYCMPCPSNVNIPACFANYNASFGIGKSSARSQYFMSVGATSDKPSGPRLCVSCGKCEKTCPQKIKIMDELAHVSKRMEPAWYRFGIWVARIFLGKEKEA